MKKILVALVTIYCVTFAYGGVDLNFKLTVLKGFKEHLDLLEHPSYVALALANNDIIPDTLGRMEIINSKTLLVNSQHLNKVRFIGRSGEYFRYETEVQPVPSITFRVPVDVNTSKIDEGIITITLHPRMANWIPQILIDKINLKMNKLLNADLQNNMLTYLNKTNLGETTTDRVSSKVEQILLHAYKSSRSHRFASLEWQPGDAEPLSKQWKLLGSLFFFIFTVPVVSVLWFFRYRNR